MRLLLCGTVLAALVVGAPGLRAQGLAEENFQVRTTGDLVALCGAQETHALYTAAQNFCHGFAVGTYRTLVEMQAGMRSKRKLFCVTDPAPTRTAAVAGFLQWTAAHTEVLALPPTDGVLQYLSQQYPCK
jgi:hypothetical protein